VKSALVTGAGGAIGNSIAEVLAGAGWHIIGLDLQFAPEHQAVLDVAVSCDISDSEAFRRTLSELAGAHEIRCLVNCAGICPVELFLASEEATWRRTCDVNFIAPLVACQSLVPAMVEAGEGRVVNITSEGSRTGASRIAVYSGTKGALLSFSKSLAQEVGRSGVTVNCVSPGTIDTPMTAPNADMAARLARKIPLGRIGQPRDVAGAVAYLVSPAACYVTGQVISVGGGLTMIG
jgi:2-hydroxycyclohexanecarboxyl-CoA dehydrogenase